ncbi:hypothetical protein [Pseudoxanthomonas sp. UTMC 1351]|uniref:hypothetical protein n=1 Tax=Pseudoxanthomonas sp. UTMC 1351 TaxID=2695853 RepID=UPI0034CFA2C3
MEPTATGFLAGLVAKFGAAKVWMALAGFMGAALSPIFITGLTRPQMFLAVLAGFCTSLFCTEMVAHLIGLENFSYGVAFCLGLMAMNIIPLGKKMLSKRVGEDA